MRPNMNLTGTYETWPGIDGWMKKKPLGMKSLMGLTSERYYSKSMLIKEIQYRMSPFTEGSMAKGLPIDMLHDFKIHFKGLFRIRYRGNQITVKGTLETLIIVFKNMQQVLQFTH